MLLGEKGLVTWAAEDKYLIPKNIREGRSFVEIYGKRRVSTI